MCARYAKKQWREEEKEATGQRESGREGGGRREEGENRLISSCTH